MTPQVASPSPVHGRRYDRDSLEFARVANLADAVFAIAMTLLVLGLEVPTVAADGLRAALAEQIPNLIAFVLSFALIANIWWQHHKFLARLDQLDGGLIGGTLVLLGLVALAPYPTGLLGAHPSNQLAVVLFVTTFIGLTISFCACVRRAHRQHLWRQALPEDTYRWVLAGFAVTVVTMLVAIATAIISTTLALAVLAASGAPERALARRAPPDYDEWA
jgi:uncharacterized membrane protein